MTKAQKWLLLSVIVFLALVGYTQQQFSGGSAVTVTSALPAGSNTIGAIKLHDGSDTSITSTGGAIDVNIKTGSVGNNAFALNAGTAKVGITYPYTSCGTTAFTSALQAMPTVSTAITASTTCVLEIAVSNTSGGALTYTISDNQGSPIAFVSAVTINSGERNTYTFPNGAKFTSGVKLNASGSGVTYALEGLQ